MFDDNNHVTELTLVMHKDEPIDDWRERNGELDIVND